MKFLHRDYSLLVFIDLRGLMTIAVSSRYSKNLYYPCTKNQILVKQSSHVLHQIMQMAEINGAQGGGRTRITRRLRDFKSRVATITSLH